MGRISKCRRYVIDVTLLLRQSSVRPSGGGGELKRDEKLEKIRYL